MAIAMQPWFNQLKTIKINKMGILFSIHAHKTCLTLWVFVVVVKFGLSYCPTKLVAVLWSQTESIR
jgi:hypothetical protein